MNIGIYGSSFDPITNVHLWTANTIAKRCSLDKVILLPCSNKRRDKALKTEDEHRLNMLQLAAINNPKLVVDDFEMHQQGWEIDTYTTMKHYKEKSPKDNFYFIMGADLLVDIGSGLWTNGDKLINENKFIVMARNEINMLKTISQSPLLRKYDNGEKFRLIDKGFSMDISSTYIRDEFSLGGDPRYMLPNACYEYIKENRLYGYIPSEEENSLEIK